MTQSHHTGSIVGETPDVKVWDMGSAHRCIDRDDALRRLGTKGGWAIEQGDAIWWTAEQHIAIHLILPLVDEDQDDADRVARHPACKQTDSSIVIDAETARRLAEPWIEVDVTSWPRVSGVQVRLYLDPESDPPKVHDWFNVGPGQPMSAYHGRLRYLADIPPDTVPESVATWLRKGRQQQILVEIAADYLGTDLDGTGSNLVGRWRKREEHEWDPKISFTSEWYNQRFDSYWEAGDWLDPIRDEVIDQALEDDDLDETAAYYVQDALPDGAHLDPKNVRECLVYWLEQVDEDDERYARCCVLLEAS